MSDKLYKAFLDGDQCAFEELVREYREPVTCFLRRFLRDDDAVEDVAADVFVVVLEKKRYRGEGNFRSWLYTIARNKAVDHIRRCKRLVPLEEAEQLPHPKGSAEDMVIAREQRETMRETLKDLKDDYRMALLLTAEEGLSYEDAAAAMKKSPTQIRNLCYRARLQLRNSVKEAEHCEK